MRGMKNKSRLIALFLSLSLVNSSRKLGDYGVAMKAIISLMGMLTLFLSLIQAQAGIFPYEYQVNVLENGLKIITIPMESNGIVSYYSVARVGSRDEWEPGHSGFAHLFEHMMFRGTKKYPGALYDQIMTAIGADANAYTTDDYTCYHLNFAAEDLATVMELESDRFINLSYSEADFKTETGAVYGEYRKSRVSPWSLIEENLYNTAFDFHTYKHTTIGFEEDIKAMPTMYRYSLSFFNRYYRPDNVVIIVAGAVRPDTVVALARRFYGNWQKGYVPPRITLEPPQTAERRIDVAYPGKTLPILTIGYKCDAYDPNNKKYVAAQLLEELAFGANSPLYKQLVIKEQKVEFIQASCGMNRDPRLFEIYAMIKDEKDIDYVRDQIYFTLEQLKINPPEEKTLNDLKRHLKYAFLMRLDTPAHVAGSLARFVALTGDIATVESFYAQIDQITPVDVQQAAQYYFSPEKRTVVLLKGAQQ